METTFWLSSTSTGDSATNEAQNIPLMVRGGINLAMAESSLIGLSVTGGVAEGGEGYDLSME